MPKIVGESNAQTRNLVVLERDARSYVNCGADIFLTGLYHDLHGEATCPMCGATIRINIEGQEVKSTDPEYALLHYIVEDLERFSISCDGTILFDKKSCFLSWKRNRKIKQGRLSTPIEFMREAKCKRRIDSI